MTKTPRTTKPAKTTSRSKTKSKAEDMVADQATAASPQGPRAKGKAAQGPPTSQLSASQYPQYQSHGGPRYHPLQYVPYAHPPGTYVLTAISPNQQPPQTSTQEPHPLQVNAEASAANAPAHIPAPPRVRLHPGLPWHDPNKQPPRKALAEDALNQLHNLQLTLSAAQVATKTAFDRYEYELIVWTRRCNEFIKERDSARERVRQLSELNAELQGFQKQSEPFFLLETLIDRPVPTPAPQDPEPEPTRSPVEANSPGPVPEVVMRSLSSQSLPDSKSTILEPKVKQEPEERSYSPISETFEPSSCNHAECKATALSSQARGAQHEHITTERTSNSRKAARGTRRHSPYSSPLASPSRRSSLPAIESVPSLNLSTTESRTPPAPSASFLQSPRLRRRAASLPDLTSQSIPAASVAPPREPTPPPPTVLPVTVPVLEERFRGFEFSIFDPLRQAGDTTVFDVSGGPNRDPDALDYPTMDVSPVKVVRAWAPQVDADGDSDMELESDDDDEEECVADARPPPPTLLGDGPGVEVYESVTVQKATPKTALDTNYINMLYTPALGKLWCRCCLLQHSDRISILHDHKGSKMLSIPPEVPNFKVESTWEDLRAHSISTHPEECERLTQLSYGERAELKKAVFSVRHF
ncbi:hypothetical protein DFP72DRAFT_389596 [Ephemerocybe angulata]|uniref:Uncharacterized protein n=1 Tax=Ephemerocybe angulata TaxID=980116 RepID=A0A8H6HYH0_9AGAR|nr:hypothetical protein DFP72DRAFT_389596 [Tulosesus angulatus]